MNSGEDGYFEKYSTQMGLPITIIIFIASLIASQLFYAVAASGIFYVGLHAIYYFKNRLEYSKAGLAEIRRQNELLTELINSRNGQK